MATKIDSKRLADTINDILEEYGQTASEAIEKSAKEVAKDVVKELKKGGSYKGGKQFNSGWSIASQKSRLGTTTVVYNKTKPGLAHLLEFGHVLRNGGRSTAFNFIAPVDATVEQKFIDDFTKNIGG